MLVLVGIIFGFSQIYQSSSSDIPKSHIPILNELLMKYINRTSAAKYSIMDVLLGNVNTSNDGSVNDLDVNILDHNALKKIIEEEKTQYYNSSIHNTRRYAYANSMQVLRNQNDVRLHNRIFDLMKQSIYTAKYRLTETKLLRIKYKEDPPYNIGIIVGNVYHIALQSEHMYDQMVYLKPVTFFMWRLILYEKLLASRTDVENLVNRAFVYQKAYEEQNAEIKRGGMGGMGGPGSPGSPNIGYKRPQGRPTPGWPGPFLHVAPYGKTTSLYHDVKNQNKNKKGK